MTFADAAKYSMTEYASIYPTMGQFLDHLFGVIGNGMEWVNGALTDGNDDVKLAALPALERAACAEQDTYTTESVPNWLRYPLEIRNEKFRPLRQRLIDGKITSLYGLSDYSRITKVPDNVQQDWFNAAYCYIILVQDTPIENFSPYRNARNDKERGFAEKHYVETQKMAADIRADLNKRFPEFAKTFVGPVGRISIDPNRPDVDGANYWPLDGSTVPMPDLVQPFRDAIEFCYRLEARPGTKGGALLRILNKVAAAAVKLGQKVTMEKVEKDTDWQDSIPSTIQAVIEQYKGVGSDLPSYFDDIVEPFYQMVKSAYRLRRININKNVPYRGYPLGHDQACCLEPVENFTAESLRYNHHDQGRDPLRTILGMMFTVISEQGVRIVRNDFIKACEGLPPETPVEERIRQLQAAMTDDDKARIAELVKNL